MKEEEEIDLNDKVPRINKNVDTASKNTILILKTMRNYINTHKKHPSINKIAQLCGLERHTVSKRLKKLTSDDCLEPYKRYTQNMMQVAVNNGLKGDLKSIKFFFQVVWGLTEYNKEEVAEEYKRPIINITTNPLDNEGINLTSNN